MPQLDLTVDGADEFDDALRLIKGGGGALLREKIVAAASDRMIVIADESKRVETLGAFPLPIEIDRFRRGRDAAACRGGGAGAWAAGEIALRAKVGSPFVTDGGNFILDCAFGAHSRSRDAGGAA